MGVMSFKKMTDKSNDANCCQRVGSRDVRTCLGLGFRVSVKVRCKVACRSILATFKSGRTSVVLFVVRYVLTIPVHDLHLCALTYRCRS